MLFQLALKTDWNEFINSITQEINNLATIKLKINPIPTSDSKPSQDGVKLDLTILPEDAIRQINQEKIQRISDSISKLWAALYKVMKWLDEEIAFSNKLMEKLEKNNKPSPLVDTLKNLERKKNMALSKSNSSEAKQDIEEQFSKDSRNSIQKLQNEHGVDGVTAGLIIKLNPELGNSFVNDTYSIEENLKKRLEIVRKNLLIQKQRLELITDLKIATDTFNNFNLIDLKIDMFKTDFNKIKNNLLKNILSPALLLQQMTKLKQSIANELDLYNEEIKACKESIPLLQNDINQLSLLSLLPRPAGATDPKEGLEYSQKQKKYAEKDLVHYQSGFKQLIQIIQELMELEKKLINSQHHYQFIGGNNSHQVDGVTAQSTEVINLKK